MKKLIIIIALFIGISLNAQVLKNSKGHIYELEQINNGNITFVVFETIADYNAFKLGETVDTDRTGVYLTQDVIKEIKELIIEIPTGSNLYTEERKAVLNYLVKHFATDLNFRNLQRNKFEKSDLIYEAL